MSDAPETSLRPEEPWALSVGRRAVGAAVRAVGVVVVVAPLIVFSARDPEPIEFLFPALVVFCLFVTERRDRRLREVPLRLAGGALLAACVALAGWVSWRNAGDVTGTGAVSDLLDVDFGEFIASCLALCVYVQLFGHLAYVRTQTKRLKPQLAAGVMMVAPALVWFLFLPPSPSYGYGSWGGEPVWTRWTPLALVAWVGVGVPLSLALIDPFCSDFGVGGPLPVEGQVTRVLTRLGYGTVALVFASGCFFLELDGMRHRSSTETPAIGALKTIGAAQALFREADKEGDGTLDYGTLAELASSGTTGLIDAVLGSGTKRGYLFEATYGATTSEFIWIATARPIRPGVSGDRYFMTNHEGVTYYTTQAPFVLDSVDCAVPAGVQPVGR